MSDIKKAIDPSRLTLMKPPPELEHILERFGFDQVGNFVIQFKRPMRIVGLRGQAEIDLIGANFPVGLLIKCFVAPMEQDVPGAVKLTD